MALYELIERPDLDEPLLVLALEGWIDAGLAAAGAAEVLTDRLDTVTVARFSTDDLLDYRARRPIAHLNDGVLRGLTWPEIELRAATDGDGNEMLLLVGAEPDRLWHRFTDEVVSLALDFGVRMCVGLGAYPFAAPHTRSPRVACTASTARLAEGTSSVVLDFRRSMPRSTGVRRARHPLAGCGRISPTTSDNMPFPGARGAVEGLTCLSTWPCPLASDGPGRLPPAPPLRADRPEPRTPGSALSSRLVEQSAPPVTPSAFPTPGSSWWPSSKISARQRPEYRRPGLAAAPARGDPLPEGPGPELRAYDRWGPRGGPTCDGGSRRPGASRLRRHCARESHDPFCRCWLAAATSARPGPWASPSPRPHPHDVAHPAWDLQAASQVRFILPSASHHPHIERASRCRGRTRRPPAEMVLPSGPSGRAGTRAQARIRGVSTRTLHDPFFNPAPTRTATRGFIAGVAS